ncbi:MAG TPA: SCO family protein [Kofleriaceae bacterium]|jgi:protein SCO1/2|nr:SCO family protein [Kofleriaceae bacterium]
MASSSLIALAGLAGALGLAVGITAGQPGLALARSNAGDPPATTAGPGSALGPGDDIAPPPPTYEANDVKVDERLGSRLPLDAVFRTQDGANVTLGQVMRGGLPAILTFNYSDCPMLCSVQLNGLTAALPKVGELGASPDPTAENAAMFRVGAQFRIVTIDLEPSETLEKAQAMRRRYLERLPEDQRKAAAAGWTFLVAAIPGDGAAIRRVADAVGFRYTYIKDRAEWAHPAALILLSAAGVVTRYLYGIEFDPKIMRESIYKAGLAEPAAAVGFMIRCYHYDPGANSHARAGVTALRFGAAGFAILLFSALGVMHFVRRSKRPLPAAPNGVT